MSETGYARLAQKPEDYEHLGLDVKTIAQWEDGQRASTDPGNFEWWYFDTHLEDGTTIVVVFYPKPLEAPHLPLTPCVEISITRPNCVAIERTVMFDPSEFSASTDGCDVRIGSNRFTGDLDTYHITATAEELSVDIELTGEVKSWRPETGHFYFADKEQPQNYFAWLPSVPQGAVKAKYSIGDETFEGNGTGYHDHNWGDAPMPELMHDWYWARAEIGPYTVIASYIISEEKYNYDPMTVFLLAKDGKLVVDDHLKVKFSTDDNSTDDKTGKPVADLSTYTYADGDTEYVISFKRQETIVQRVFADGLPSEQRQIAKDNGIDSAYMRLRGTATLEKRENGEVVESFENPAVWEQMYLGKTRTPDV